ncbi:hypothetical protein C0993_001479 [Termitomyces sp. T159_Od127]|nr:hypothetical protein C0993_001479 [Termitomyces sp. T159_Od127]
MSKPALDSELYDDIYGDDELTDFPAETSADADLDEAEEASAEKAPSPTTVQPPKKPQDGRSSLPPKPATPNSLSYSAQIAQQFSAYQQTPSQERQQRTTIPLPDNPRTTGAAAAVSSISTSPIATHETSNDSVFGKKPSEMHDSGKLFIGGLNWDTTDGILPLHHVVYYLKVDACTIMRDAAGTSRGFAFLTFEDANAVNAVVTREHVLDGKTIDPKRAIPREEHLRNTRYFVGGLSPNTTAESMKEFFGAFGKVVDATVMVDRESGRSKGFGFVTYEDASNADQLVGKIGLILDDKQIEVKMAQPRSQRDQARAVANTATTSTGQNVAGFTQPMQGMAAAMNFTPQQQQQPNQMGMMFNRPMGQVGMMGGNMPMMNMNPMAMAMGMGMGGFNPMMNGMNMMGGMNGMAGMAGMNGMGNMGGAMGGMGNMGAMRLGMGPMGMGTGMGNSMAGTGMVGAGGMGGMNMLGMAGLRNNMAGMTGGGANFGRPLGAAAVGPGPARATSRGQHNFHPYSR